MNKPTTWLSVLSAALFAAAMVSADDMSGDMPEQSGKMGKVKKNEASTNDADKYKSAFGPHGVMIQTSLESALDQVKGLKAQLDISSPESMEHIKMHTKEINADLKTASTHQTHLQNKAKQFPDVAQSDEFRAENSAFTELNNLNKSWQAKAGQGSYWQDRTRVKSDLDMLENRLTAAIDKTKSFNADKMDVSVG